MMPSDVYLSAFARTRPDARPHRDPATLTPVAAVVPEDCATSRYDRTLYSYGARCRVCRDTVLTIADRGTVCRACILEGER